MGHGRRPAQCSTTASVRVDSTPKRTLRARRRKAAFTSSRLAVDGRPSTLHAARSCGQGSKRSTARHAQAAKKGASVLRQSRWAAHGGGSDAGRSTKEHRLQLHRAPKGIRVGTCALHYSRLMLAPAQLPAAGSAACLTFWLKVPAGEEGKQQPMDGCTSRTSGCARGELCRRLLRCMKQHYASDTTCKHSALIEWQQHALLAARTVALPGRRRWRGGSAGAAGVRLSALATASRLPQVSSACRGSLQGARLAITQGRQRSGATQLANSLAGPFIDDTAGHERLHVPTAKPGRPMA